MIDPAGTLAKYLNALLSEYHTSLNVAMVCKVISFDESTSLASIQPLIQTTDEQPKPIENVSILGMRYKFLDDVTDNNIDIKVPCVKEFRPFLMKNDIVLVAFADAEIKNVLSGQIAIPDSNRKHDLNDAVIVGVFPCSLSN